MAARQRLVDAAPGGWRDPWLWLSAASVLPLVAKSLGAPLGEPAAEDFDFLSRAMRHGPHSWLDGGGSLSFWRPLAQQGYYGAIGGLMLAHPLVLAALHASLLAGAAMLLYRVFSRGRSRPLAAAVASFPFLAESVRALIAWPSHFADLGCLFFSALALHEASRRRMPTSLAALAAALLCKEQAVVTAVMIPLLPDFGTGSSANLPGVSMNRGGAHARARWAIATGLLTMAWALGNAGVRRSAGLALPHDLGIDAAAFSATFVPRVLWAIVNSLRAGISLPAATAPADGWWGLGAALILTAAVIGLMRDAGARARIARARAPILWGLSWFALSCAMLAPAAPLWAPNRTAFGSVGLGVALVEVLFAALSSLVVPLVALRLAALALSPGPPAIITPGAPETGNFIDFVKIVRIQRLMRETRDALAAGLPAPPPGARVAWTGMPRGTVYAFGGDKAVQAWYRDTTLRCVEFEAVARDTAPLDAIVQYQVEHVPQLALVAPAAMRALVRADTEIAGSRWNAAVASLGEAEALQRDAAARVFLSDVRSRLALCRLELGDASAADREARSALVMFPGNERSRYLLATMALVRGDPREAGLQLDTLISFYPGDTLALGLRAKLRASR